MKQFDLRIDSDALDDLQRATDWYNKQLFGLGTRFQSQVKAQINALPSKYHHHFDTSTFDVQSSRSSHT